MATTKINSRQTEALRVLAKRESPLPDNLHSSFKALRARGLAKYVGTPTAAVAWEITHAGEALAVELAI